MKNKLLKQFTSSSTLRVIVATSAFGMGVDCPDVLMIQKCIYKKVEEQDKIEGLH